MKRGRRKRDLIRKGIDVFLTTEVGEVSKETEKITVFKEGKGERADKSVQVFSVPRKRAAESIDEEGEGTSTRHKVKPIIPGLSPEEWTGLLYPKG